MCQKQVWENGQGMPNQKRYVENDIYMCENEQQSRLTCTYGSIFPNSQVKVFDKLSAYLAT